MDWAKDDAGDDKHNDDDDDTIPLLTLEMIRMLLLKCSMSRAPGAGGRAERNFYRLTNKSNGTKTWRSDAGCVYHVADAYLQEHTFSLKHLQKADRFVRKCVREVGLRANNASTTNTYGDSWRVFDRLFEAYTSPTFNATDSVKALHQADALYRFFLVQHREGRVTSEEPDHVHLERILQLWTRHRPRIAATSSSSSVTDDDVGWEEEKRREYHRLRTSLYQRGNVPSRRPDTASRYQACGMNRTTSNDTSSCSLRTVGCHHELYWNE